MKFRVKVIIARRFRWLPPRLFASVMQLIFHRRLCALRNPKNYTELLAVKSLLEDNALVQQTADKYSAREYIAGKVGAEYLPALLQVVENADDIDFDSLSSPCVIKATHGYDMTILVKRYECIDRAAIKSSVRRWLATDFYRSTSWRERPYAGAHPRVVIEEFLGDGITPPTDFKFFVFGGRVGFVQVDVDRFTHHLCDTLSPDWNRLDYRAFYLPPEEVSPRPDNLDQMIEIAERLAEDFHFVRVDLYSVDGRIYVGELTHTPGAGIVPITPRAMDEAIGELWRNGTPIPDSLVTKC